MHKDIQKYFTKFINDTKRCSDTKCKKEKLPYITENGNIINVDKFSEPALTFEKHKYFTNYPRGSKGWVDYWTEQHERVKNGYWCGQVRISGFYYFFLNFHRMKIADSVEGEKEGFGKFMRMQFYLFHLIEYAEYRGDLLPLKDKENLAAIKVRGMGFTEMMAAIGESDTMIPPTTVSGDKKFNSNVYFAADGKYLIGDDKIFTKITKALTWLNQNTNGGIYKPFTHTMKNDEMHWVAGYRDKRGEPIQTGGEIKCTITKKPDDARAGRKTRCLWEECLDPNSKVVMFDGGLKMIKDIQVGDFVMGVDGSSRTVLHKVEGESEMYSIKYNMKNSKQNREVMKCTGNHKLYVYDAVKKLNYIVRVEDFIQSKRMNNVKLVQSKGWELPKKEVSLDPYFLGLWLGDGSSADQVIVVNEKDKEISDFLNTLAEDTEGVHLYSWKPSTKVYSKGNQCYYYRLKQDSNTHRKGSNPILKGLQDYDLINNKHIPQQYLLNDRKTRLEVLAGIIDTDGSLVICKQSNKSTTEHFKIEMSRKNIIDQCYELAISLGFKAYQYVYYPNKERNPRYSVIIKGKISEIPTRVKRKKANDSRYPENFYNFKIEKLENKGKYVGITLDKDQLFILENGIITHNSGANQVLGATLTVALPLTKRLNIRTGTHIIWGTSNADSRGIDAFKKVLHNPEGYDCLKFQNVWRELEKGKEYLSMIPVNPFEFLIPSWESEKGVGYFIPTYDIMCLDVDGNSNREKAYDLIIAERHRKINANNGEEDDDILTYIADHPIYMEEALIVSKGKRFSSNELSRQIVNIETKVIEPEIFRGDLEFVLNKKNEVQGVKFIPYRKGVIKLLEIPKYAEKQGNDWFVPYIDELPNKLYIGGIDSIDQGKDDSTTKGSNLACLVKKRFDPDDGLNEFNNCYVGIYNERPKYAKDGHENVLKLLMFYRAIGLLEYAKIGILNYIVDEMKLGKYLAYEPSAPGEAIKNYKRKRNKKGLRVTSDIIHFQLGLIEEYIRENHKKILFKELLEQLSMYTVEDKTKYDLIAAMGMCEVLSTEFREILPISEIKEKTMRPMRWYKIASGKRVFGIPPTYDDFKNNGQTPYYIDVKTGQLINY